MGCSWETAVRETSQHSLRMTEIERKGPIPKPKPQSISVGLEKKRFSFTPKTQKFDLRNIFRHTKVDFCLLLSCVEEATVYQSNRGVRCQLRF